MHGKPRQPQAVDGNNGIIQVIIETPKGSRNESAFDVEQNIFTVKKVLPAGMSFPTISDSCPGPLRPTSTPSTFSWLNRPFPESPSAPVS
jgi:hypothetical protein